MYLTVAVVGNGGKLLDATKGLSKYNAYDNENDDDNCFSVNTDYHELWIFVPKNEEKFITNSPSLKEKSYLCSENMWHATKR